MRPVFAITALFSIALLAPGHEAVAQQARTFGDYEVHFNTMNTNLLTPEVASAYGIQRAGTRALLNITVLDQGEPTHAGVAVTATNLTGQRRTIEMKEINDQGAIYYIGQFRIHDEEMLDFSASINPEGHDGQAFELTFRQQFFTD